MSDALLSRSELPSEADRHRPPAVAEIRRLLPGLDVLSLLGSGGMSAVYLAMQTMLDRPVAIKLLSPVLSQLPGYTQRFTQEARAMARLRHPGIAAVYDVGQTAEGRLYLVMEFIEGTNLAEVIARRKLTVEEALALAVEVCEALAFAHRHGVIHRDVKPANIMLEKGGRARLIDFGLARLHESITDRGMTIVGTVVGTPGYMAPEQERGEPADHRADLYSTGAMLYEVLCGSLPQGLGLPPSRLSGCTRRVDQVIFKALQADPANRYQTALEMQRALQRAARRWGDRLPAALLVGALLVLAGAGAWWHHSRRLSTVLAPPPAADSSPKVAAAPPAAAAPFVNSLGMRFLPVPIEGGPTAVSASSSAFGKRESGTSSGM